VVVDNNDSEEVTVKFYGYNQERGKDETVANNYLFVGYDIYYYFLSKSDVKKKAMVKQPKVPSNNKLRPFPAVDVDYEPTQSEAKNKKRFPEINFSPGMDNFFKEVTYPVTIEMIKNVLISGANNNVRFSFKTEYPDMTSDVYSNPFEVKDAAGNYIQFGGIYPYEDDYINASWGDEKDGYTFYGFYDKDFYDFNNIAAESDDGSYSFYKVYFYIVAKGFRDADLSNRNRSYLESAQSSHVEVRFKVDNRKTKDHN